MRPVAACALLAALVPGVRAQSAGDSTRAAADSLAAVTPTAAIDTTVAADTTVVADTTAAADSVAAPWFPSPVRRALRSFRLDWSTDRETIPFGDPSDPTAPPGLHSLAAALRLSPAVQTRELSPGPTVESFGLDGGGSGRAALLFRGRSTTVPGTSGPHSHEWPLTEMEGFTILRGGAAALYGPEAVSGAVVVEPRHPVPDELLSRAIAEEGVDDYQRGAFHLARRVGSHGSLFLSSESRRIAGFLPGTKEVDRFASGSVLVGLGSDWETAASYRHYDGDGRHGEFGEASVLTNRGDYHLELFRSHGNGRGSLLEGGLVRERLERFVKTANVTTHEIRSSWTRLTTDLPTWRGWEVVARGEAARWEFRDEPLTSTSQYVVAAGALRIGRRLPGGRAVAATVRLDGEEDRKRAIQARLEGEQPFGPGSVFAVLSRGERIPDRGAAGSDNEVHDAATAGYRLRTSIVRARAAAFASRVRDFRRDPTFDELRSRTPVLDAPLGHATIRGASLGFDTDAFALPGVRFLGRFVLRSSVTWLEADMDDTGERLPGRPRFTWTGEGHLERYLFQDELLARLRGRLTHWGDRVDEAGSPVVDLWTTDVLLDGRIGDAIFFFRFHDLLERADAIEPGYRLPGFSRMYGISWRFVG